jgi:RimJ/RimL family protein N-acetyltransferase
MFGVCEDMKGTGLAKEIISEFEKELRNNRQINKYGLSTLRHNYRAIRFYEKTGFVKTGENDNAIFFIKNI